MEAPPAVRRGRKAAAARTTYEDVFGGPPRFSDHLPSRAVADYAEIFRAGIASSCSIPFLRIPAAAAAAAEGVEAPANSRGGAGFSYEDVFRRFDAGNFAAATYEELLQEQQRVSSSSSSNASASKESYLGRKVMEGLKLNLNSPPHDRTEHMQNGNMFSRQMHTSAVSKEEFNVPNYGTGSGRFGRLQEPTMGTAQKDQVIEVPNFVTDLQGTDQAKNGSKPSESSKSNSSTDMQDKPVTPKLQGPTLGMAQKYQVLEVPNFSTVLKDKDQAKNGLKPSESSKRNSSTDTQDKPPVMTKLPAMEEMLTSAQSSSRSSSYRSVSSGDMFYPEATYVTISDINLRTQPNRVPPPSRPAPKVVGTKGHPRIKMHTNSKTDQDEETSNRPMLNHSRYPVEGVSNGSVRDSSNKGFSLKVDASSAAAMKEAMDQAQAKMQSAKELIERRRVNVPSRKNLRHHEGMDFKDKSEDNHTREIKSFNAAMSWEDFMREEKELGALFTLGRQNAGGTSHVAETDENGTGDIRQHLNGDLKSSHPAYDFGGRFGEWRTDEQFHELTRNTDKYTNLHKETEGTSKIAGNLYKAKGTEKMRLAYELHRHKENEKNLDVVDITSREAEAKKLFLNATQKAHVLENGKSVVESHDVYSTRDEDTPEVKDVYEIQFSAGGSAQSHVKEPLVKGLEDKVSYSCEKVNGNISNGGLHVKGSPSGLNMRHKNKLMQEDQTGVQFDHEMENGIDNVYQISDGVDIPVRLHRLSNGEYTKKYQVSEPNCFGEENEITSRTCVEFEEEGNSSLTGAGDVDFTVEGECTPGMNGALFRFFEDTEEIEATNKKIGHLDLVREHRAAKGITEHPKVKTKELKLENTPKAIGLPENEKKIEAGKEESGCIRKKMETAVKRDGQQDQHEKEAGDGCVECIPNDKGKRESEVPFDLDDPMKLKGEQVVENGNKKRLDIHGDSDSKANCHEINATNFIQRPFENSEAALSVRKADKPNYTDFSSHNTTEIEEANVNSEGNQDNEGEEERGRKLKEDKEREREREKDRLAVENASREARERLLAEYREMAERVVMERVSAEARKRELAVAKARVEKASSEALEKSLSGKASRESRLRTERAAVERATTEARERAMERAMAERASAEVRERNDRHNASSRDRMMKDDGAGNGAMVSDKSNLAKNIRRTSSDIGSSSSSQRQSSPLNHVSNVKSVGVSSESTSRSKARIERHQRTVERAAKALAEKNRRDILAQREQAERNRLADSLDAEVKRWSNGKEGNLRALLSTLQYILGPNSGWQPIPLTEVVTAAGMKRAYRKATLCVHPDKLQQRGASIQQKYICEKVFDLLKEAWNRFNSEER